MITRREFQFACLASLIVSSCGNDAHASLATVQLPSAAWTQWGGPKRNFTAPLLTDGDNLPTPQLVWKRELGKGHAAIVSDGKYAYSLRLDKQQEVLEKCSVETGDLIWTSRYAIGFHASIAEYDGPHSTPVLLDDRIVVVGIDAGVHAFDVLTGKALWSCDLQTDVGTILPQSGYAASPLVWRGQLIVPTLGNARSDETERYEPNFMGKGIPGAVALDIRTGKEIWRSESFRSSHASPILIGVDGQPTVVFHGMFELVGIDPQDGNVLWRQLLRREAADNVTFTPIWDAARRQVLISHGTNEGKQKVSMTTPVFMEREADDRQGQMGFVMPKKVSEQGIPEPTNKSVLIQQRVGGRFAVIRFAGRTNDESMRAAEQKLRSWMDVKGLVPDGDAEVAGYDPPWTPGPLRRNEILIRCK